MGRKKKTRVSKDTSRTEWDKVASWKIPYVSHVPESPNKMTNDRKERIRKVIYWHNQDKDPKWIAEKLNVTPLTVKRDLTTAIELTRRNLPYIPKVEKEIMKEVSTSLQKSDELFGHLQVIVKELEDNKAHLDAKHAAAYSMLIGELRQTLELHAKLSGELQTGTRVNVLVFSDLVKKIIAIIEAEVDRDTFMRIRDRIKLEMEGRQPLGPRGGDVTVVEGQIIEGEIE